MTVVLFDIDSQDAKTNFSRPNTSICLTYKHVKSKLLSQKVRISKLAKNNSIKHLFQINSSTGMDPSVSSCKHAGDDPCPIGTPVSLAMKMIKVKQ